MDDHGQAVRVELSVVGQFVQKDAAFLLVGVWAELGDVPFLQYLVLHYLEDVLESNRQVGLVGGFRCDLVDRAPVDVDFTSSRSKSRSVSERLVSGARADSIRSLLMNRKAVFVVALLASWLLVLLAACGASDQDQPAAGSGPLTVENNVELAALLAGPSVSPDVFAFSEKYSAERVEFDAVVTDIYINPREAYGKSTINVMAGSASDPQRTGPVFQLSWFGQDSPLKQFAVGANVRVKAEVGSVYGFEPYQFYLVEGEGATALSPR